MSDFNRLSTASKTWRCSFPNASAYMELVRANAQGELTALERGMHALHSGKSIRAYADDVGRKAPTVQNEREAAEVAVACMHVHTDLSDNFRSLTAIHAAPRWLWPALVSHMVADGWTVEATRKAVAGVKEAPEPPLLRLRTPNGLVICAVFVVPFIQ